MRAPTSEYHLKPVVMHRNKEWQPPHDDHDAVNDGFYVRQAPCGTDWRHCPVRWDCDLMGMDTPEVLLCDRMPQVPNNVLPERSFEDIDLTMMNHHLHLIVDKGSLRFVKLPRTDRELLISYEKEYAKTEHTHISGNYQSLLAEMLTARGYSTDIVDIRRRLW